MVCLKQCSIALTCRLIIFATHSFSTFSPHSFHIDGHIGHFLKLPLDVILHTNFGFYTSQNIVWPKKKVINLKKNHHTKMVSIETVGSIFLKVFKLVSIFELIKKCTKKHHWISDALNQKTQIPTQILDTLKWAD